MLHISSILNNINLIYDRKIALEEINKKLIGQVQIIDRTKLNKNKELQALYTKLNPDLNKKINIQKISGKLTINDNLIDIMNNMDNYKFDVINQFYDHNESGWWVDFASHEFGRYHSKVENSILENFPELDIIFKNNMLDEKFKYIDPTDSKYKDRSGAIIVTNLLNKNKKIYGNIIAIDANKFTKYQQASDYKKDILIAYITKAYNGFVLAKKLGSKSINTGSWGSGKYYNNAAGVMYAVQAIAGALADINIIFNIKLKKDQSSDKSKKYIKQKFITVLKQLGWYKKKKKKIKKQITFRKEKNKVSCDLPRNLLFDESTLYGISTDIRELPLKQKFCKNKYPGKYVLYGKSIKNYLNKNIETLKENISLYKKWGRVNFSEQQGTQLLNKIDNYKVNSTNVQFNKYFYKYDKLGDNIYWVDFANERLGGGALGHGFVQEEKMCFIFPELLGIIYNNNKVINGEFQYIENKYKKYRERSGAIVIKNLYKSLVSEGTPMMDNYYDCSGLDEYNYGPKNNKTYYKCFNENGELLSQCVDIEKEEKYINIIAIDALNLKHDYDGEINIYNKHGKGNSYKATLEDYGKPLLQTYVSKAFNGFSLAKEANNNKSIIVHTGGLGAGVFFNKASFSCATQIIAAMLVKDVTIQFHGINKMTINFINKDVEDMIKYVFSVPD